MALTEIPIELSSTPGIVDNSNATAITIDSSENVGIGTSSPARGLSIHKEGNQLQLTTNTTGTAAGNGTDLKVDASTSDFQLLNYESANTTFWTSSVERLRIDSSGNVLVGRTSASYSGVDLHVGDTSDGQNGIQIQTSTTGYGYVLFGDGTGVDAYRGQITYKHGDDYMGMHTAGSERLRIDASGNVGIACTPSVPLEVNVTGAGDVFKLTRDTGTNGELNIDFSGGITNFNSEQGGYTFTTSSVNNAMSIDASGNLLVGGTSAFGADTITLGTGGFASIRNTSGSCLELRRDSDDGSILYFQKDGTTVGSIGVSSFDLTIHSSASGHNGLRFGEAWIAPIATNQSLDDGTTDLGLSGARFKDLYLSGGAYLGGTGAANKLDDYEEGTWTPTFGGSTTNPTVSYAQQDGVYTKIGNMVTATCVIGTSTNTGGAGNIKILGLPFPARNDTAYRARDMINTYNLDVDTNCVGVGIEGVQNDSYLLLLESRDNTTWRSVTWTQATSASIYFAFTFQYYV